MKQILILTALVLSATAVSAPAIAQTTATGATTAQPPAPVDKKICRRKEAEVGSIMGGGRVCHTKAEWSAIDAETARQTEMNQLATGRRGGGMGRN